MLYISTGDGTSDSDNWVSGQTLDDLLGGVLRIDISETSEDEPYRIPADNPFINLPTRGASCMPTACATHGGWPWMR